MPFDADKRQAWHYIPSSMMDAQGGRRGLELKRMTPQQRLFAIGLLNTALSHHGQLQATTIMALETVLRDIENGNPARDSEMYHVAIYGTPAADRTWGWSFEGHHLSVNLMLIDGTRFSVTPSFWGSNPAVVKTGPLEGLDTLAVEQQLARELARSLTDQQKQKAVIAQNAPRDVITAAKRKVDRGDFDPPQGIPFGELDASQQEMLLRLVREYALKYRQPIVDQIAQRAPIIDGNGMVFAWAGGMEPGKGITTGSRPLTTCSSMTTRRTARTTCTPCGAASTGISAKICCSNTTRTRRTTPRRVIAEGPWAIPHARGHASRLTRRAARVHTHEHDRHVVGCPTFRRQLDQLIASRLG